MAAAAIPTHVRRWLASLLVVASSTCVLGPASARPDSPRESFDHGTAALGEGRFSDAILHFEQLSDLGTRDANVSFNRAIAYLQRAESTKPRPGDLGQAAAGLREAQLFGDDSEETANALENVRRTVSQKRAELGADPVVVRPALGRAALTVVPEKVWTLGALLSSLLLAVGLALRDPEPSPRALAGQVASASGLLLLVLCATLTWLTAELRRNEHEAVIIASETRMLDAQGKPLTSRALDVNATAIPEAASVFAAEQRGRLVRVYWGASEAWVQLEHLRFVGRDLEL